MNVWLIIVCEHYVRYETLFVMCVSIACIVSVLYELLLLKVLIKLCCIIWLKGGYVLHSSSYWALAHGYSVCR